MSGLLRREEGTTGQAEALMLAVAKGLLAFEPDLKAALRRGKFPTAKELYDRRAKGNANLLSQPAA